MSCSGIMEIFMKLYRNKLGKEVERIPINSVEDLKAHGWDRIQCARCKWPKKLKEVAEAKGFLVRYERVDGYFWKGEAICKKCKEKEG